METFLQIVLAVLAVGVLLVALIVWLSFSTPTEKPDLTKLRSGLSVLVTRLKKDCPGASAQIDAAGSYAQDVLQALEEIDGKTRRLRERVDAADVKGVGKPGASVEKLEQKVVLLERRLRTMQAPLDELQRAVRDLQAQADRTGEARSGPPATLGEPGRDGDEDPAAEPDRPPSS